MELHRPSEFPPRPASTRMGWVPPSCPFSRQVGLQGLSGARSPRRSCDRRGAPLLGSCSPSECSELPRPPGLRSLSVPDRTDSTSHEVSSPSAFRSTRQQHDGRACLTRPLAPSGFRDPSAPSSAPCLPALFRAGSAPGVPPFRAFFLSRRRPPSPTPFPSCRWMTREPLHPAGTEAPFRAPDAASSAAEAAGTLRRGSRARRRSGSRHDAQHHLQALAEAMLEDGRDASPASPSPSGVRSTRESASGCERFRSTVGAWLSWASALQGAPPRRGGAAFAVPPLLGFVRRPQAISGRPSRVSTATRLAGLLRDCRPSWALSPPGPHAR